MKKYELTVLIHPDAEVNLEPTLTKINKILADNGATVLKESNEGKKRMAYRISSQDFAIYYYYELELPANAPRKISSTLNITDEVLRYLLVTADIRKEKYEEKRRAHQEYLNSQRATASQEDEGEA